MSSSEVDETTDWYAVGVMLYEALTGALPFSGPPVKVLLKKQKERPKAPAERVGSVPEALSELAMDLLHIDLTERPDGDEILARLAEFSGTDETEPTPTPARTRLVDETFVGRSAELDGLHSAWEEVDRAPVVQIVSGEAGVGKSILVRRFLDTLSDRQQELVVLFGRCYESETVPFKAFDGVVDALSHFLKGLDPLEAALLLPNDMSELVRVFPVLDRVPEVADLAVGGRTRGNARDVRLRAFECLRELLGRIGTRYPLVLYIDDLQWADTDSLVLLNDLIGSESAPRMLLVATRRPIDEDAGREPLERRLQDADVRVMELGGLSKDEVSELVADIDEELELDSVDEARESWLEQAEGHPLLLQELVRHYAETSNDPDSVPSLEQLIWRRIEGLDELTRGLVEMCGLAGIPLPLATVRQSLELDGDEAHRAAQTGKALHLVRLAPGREHTTVEPYHDRVREATRDNMPSDRHIDYTERLIDAMRETGVSRTEPLAFVSMLLDAGFDEEAAEEAIGAAERANEALAFETAANLYKIARRAGSFSGEEDRQLRLAIAENLNNAGHGAEAPDYWLSAVEGADPEERLELHQRASAELISQGDIDRGTAILREVFDNIDESLPESRIWIVLLLLWNRILVRIKGWTWEERPEESISRREKTRVRVYGIAARRIGMLDSVRGLYFQSRQLRLALRSGYTPEIAIALANEGQFGTVRGKKSEIARSREALALATDIAQELNDRRTTHIVGLLEAIADFFQMRFSSAYESLVEHQEKLRHQPFAEQYMLNLARLFEIYTLKYLGRLREARRKLEEHERDAAYRNDGFMLTGVRWFSSFAYLAQDRPEKASRVLDGTHWQAEGGRMKVFAIQRAMSRAEIALYHGTVRERQEEIVSALRRACDSHVGKGAAELRSLSSWMVGRLTLASSEPLDTSKERAIAGFVRDLDGEYLRLFGMWARFLEAGLAHRRGDEATARSMLRRAIKVGEDHDVDMFVACARFQLSRLLSDEAADETRSRAMEWMNAEGVVDPDRFVRIFVPGFDQIAHE
jgi:GTPase SAR1 family protein